nr:preprotein translocase subunit SecG [uncultured Brevundimonas sp.]
MLQTILLVAIIIVAISLTGVVLLQRSEGGALGMGGGPSGFMTARGAGNLLTVITWWLAGILFALTIGLTVVGNMDRASVSIIDANAVGSLATQPQSQQQPAQAQPAAPARPTAPSLDDLEASLPSTAAHTPAPASPPRQ